MEVPQMQIIWLVEEAASLTTTALEEALKKAYDRIEEKTWVKSFQVRHSRVILIKRFLRKTRLFVILECAVERH